MRVGSQLLGSCSWRRQNRSGWSLRFCRLTIFQLHRRRITLPSAINADLWNGFEAARHKLFAITQTGRPGSRYKLSKHLCPRLGGQITAEKHKVWLDRSSTPQKCKYLVNGYLEKCQNALALHFCQIGGFKAARATLGVRQRRQLAKPRKPHR
jgi:hypothetical protein